MTDQPTKPQTSLINFRPRHDSLVGIDSDGCVFDTMEIKQKQCFHGLTIQHFHLEAIDPSVRETLEFVNLYSRWRGTNRFLALLKSFELLRKRTEVIASGIQIPDLPSFTAWTQSSPALGNSDLERATELTGDPELASILAWSKAVNAEIARKVANTQPFQWAAKGLQAIQAHSDAICVSQTPVEALTREWDSAGILAMVSCIAGQEMGTKAEHIALATSGKYFPDRVLMIGDALGDRDAAQANSALFYPIYPSQEEASWERFCSEAYDRFLNGTYAGDYANNLIADFERLLPKEPSW